MIHAITSCSWNPRLMDQADVVFGNRIHGGPHRVLYFSRYAANRGLTLFTNILTGLNLSVLRTDVLRRINLKSDSFGVAWSRKSPSWSPARLPSLQGTHPLRRSDLRGREEGHLVGTGWPPSPTSSAFVSSIEPA
jgi:hypothetical protein